MERQMTDKKPDLLPCPFCGGDAAVVDLNDTGGVRVAGFRMAVRCSKCGATVEGRSTLHSIKTWNRRAIDVDALREVVDELECALRPKDYTSVDALCELSNDASRALAKRIRKAVGL